MAFLTKSSILALKDLAQTEVPVPEWGGAVLLRELTGAERDAWESSVVGDGSGPKQLANVRARLVVMCAIDDKGDRLFADAEAADLGKKSGRVLDRLFDAAMKLSKLRRADVESAEKNSDAGPSAGSSSGSASNSDGFPPITSPAS